ncbi:hypothetical protein [Chryseobacterium arthrosphaerae]|uniref:hypothetical protein n=1 Tax=Chryseobacterium arthrosphaerae TaxID=651561 RepID=UPI0031D804DD
MRKLLLGLLPLVLIACKKEAPVKKEEVKTTVNTCNSSHFMKKILELDEMKAQAKFLDSLTKGKGGIAFLTDSTKVKDGWEYSISAGYNGPDRFETYYIFYASSKDCNMLKIAEPVSGETLTIEEWRKRKDLPVETGSYLKKGIYNLPVESLPQVDVKWLETDFFVEGSEQYSCGNPMFRYFPLTRYKNMDLILVPMDCGDFDYRYSLLTVLNNKIIGELYVEGLWYDPGKDDKIEEFSSYEISKTGKITVAMEQKLDGNTQKTTNTYYQIMDDGTIKPLKK